MISIMVVTHYTLGDSYRRVVQHFFGEHVPDCSVIACDEQDTQESLLPRVKQLIGQIPENQGILILTDVFGATPCNVLNHIKSSRAISVVTGVNVPMLVKALQDAHKYDDVSEFSWQVANKAKEGILCYDLSD